MNQVKEQFDYYIAHQDQFVEKYNGKVIALKDNEVIGAYDSYGEAVTKVQALGHELGTFCVQLVTPGDEAYTMTIYTNTAELAAS